MTPDPHLSEVLPATVIHIHRSEGPEYRDSIELGTAKSGSIKCYGDASRPDDFKKRLSNMIELRRQAIEEMGGLP